MRKAHVTGFPALEDSTSFLDLATITRIDDDNELFEIFARGKFKVIEFSRFQNFIQSIKTN